MKNLRTESEPPPAQTLQTFTGVGASACRLGATWEFPKIGDPNGSTLNSRILIIRTPNKVTPFSQTPTLVS